MPKQFRAAITALASAQKSGSGAPPYSRWVNRPLGRVLAALAWRVGLSPNQVTMLSAACSFIAIGCLALLRPSVAVGLGVGLLLILGYALDSADGQVARLSGRGSSLGEWLDHVVDAAKIVSLHLAVAISLYRFGAPAPGWLLVPLGYAVVATVFFFSFILIGKLRLQAGIGGERIAVGGARIQTLAAIPTDYGLLCVVFLLLGWPSVFLAAYGLLFAGHTVVLLAALVRWWRELAARP